MLYCDQAYAKVNLHLNVLDKRSNGYHNIFSIMSSVSLFDLLKLYECDLSVGNLSRLKVDIVSDGGRFPELISKIDTEQNLIYKAIREYAAATGHSGVIRVGVEKNIPAGAGLGGGSSDAAAMLRMLNRQYRLLTDEELLMCASKIGADVPFCVKGGVSICTGIGEIIERISVPIPFHVLLVNNGVHVDTKDAYKSVDEERKSRDNTAVGFSFEQITDSLKKGDFDSFFNIADNDFEKSVFRLFPSISELKNEVSETGALFSMMTGSGSTVFGIYDNLEGAEKACERFGRKGFYAIVANFAAQ